MTNLQDEVLLQPSTSSTNFPKSATLVYFIPGNPGMVEYYRHFLSYTQKHLSTTQRQVTIIYGASHDGFEIHASNPPTASHGHNPPFSLEEVIEGTKRKISTKARDLQADQVVLIGHSVGAYILLEVLTWHQQQRPSLPYKITGGICLFPTIVDIARSSKGRIMSRILPLPGIPALAQFLARLLSCIPLWLWNWPKMLTPGEKRPEHTAVTEAMIRSRHGAKQTVFLAADEMISIRGDKWHPFQLWGALPHLMSEREGNVDEERLLVDVSEAVVQASKEVSRTKLFFYWGDNDYWVDNETRNTLIAERARREGDSKTDRWPEMVVDRHQMDHCFSLNEKHSNLVGKQVAEWIEETGETL